LADEPDGARRKLSPTERMAAAHLKATHEAVLSLRKSRMSSPSVPGLNDYRAILHAHAEDSAHTGGTRAEMLADARRAGVAAILLTDHHRPPKDFVTDSWRGLRDGVLFLPGSEDRGFLLYPTHSIMNRMKEPTPGFIKAVNEDGGLIFLSHIEERPDHPMTGLDGLEIYNRHADAKKDRAGLLGIVLKLTDPASLREFEESLRLYPDELFAAQVEYPSDYLAKWDAETKARRLTGVAANDCHHNQILLVKMVDVSATLRPGIRAMTKGRKPGDILARLDLDPYHRSFQNVSTHILAPALDEASIRSALRAGRVYVSHDWICDPTGFQFALETKDRRTIPMGDEATFSPSGRLIAQFPLTCRIRLLKHGEVIAEKTGTRMEHEIQSPGAYRVEGWITLDGEDRPWIYSNPIYLR
jgi:hypothetical protein